MSDGQPSRVLVVDDDPALRVWLSHGLATNGLVIEAVEKPEAVLHRVAGGDVDLVVTDLRMPGMTGVELCAAVARQSPGLPVLVLTAYADYDAAIGALRAGAYDLLLKPLPLEALRAAVARALSHASLKREVRRLQQRLDAGADSGLIGESPTMQELQPLLARVARTESSLLITGESGTGKEVVARALHTLSASSGRFVAVNCAAIPEQLLESELFGHERGAFTDARGAQRGLFAEADGGTLFLDEIGELPLALQPKLLRALQERCIRPLGSRKDVPFAARIVCATNRDLVAAVEEGRFRQDLYFRINVIEVSLPPLRARGNDVLLLATHFLGLSARRAKKPVLGFTSEVAATLLNYPWPGNVRELSNVIERAVVLTNHDHVTLADLPKHVVEQVAPAVVIGSDASQLTTLEELERRYVLHVLEAVGGSRSAAAKILGVDRTTLWRRMERYGLHPGVAPPAPRRAWAR